MQMQYKVIKSHLLIYIESDDCIDISMFEHKKNTLLVRRISVYL